ncbi:MAG: Bax inhibitor-1/YccA family protein [Rickettsiales bacterium]|jgi:FtsH-binding integral membrane protein|nr:Bax inhibitor-1/YccA family protein [Rickettsiales bacterium]
MKYVNIYSSSQTASFDGGLRDYLQLLYKNMGIALLTSGLAAFVVSSSPLLLRMLFSNGLVAMVVALAPLIFAVTSGLGKLSPSVSAEKMRTNLFIYSVLLGISLSSIFVVYTAQSVALAFLTTALSFAAMSLYGYRTKRDLSGLTSFLYMGLLGIIIASIVNLFLRSSMVEFFLSCAGVLLFVLLTAYDVQKLRSIYNEHAGAGPELIDKLAVRGALELYLDFVNLFLYLLRFFAKRRED